MRIAIIQFPGSNCERETMLAVKRSGMQPEEFLWNAPKERLADYAGFVIVGGFSYEDRSRAGIIAALDPIMQTLKQQSALGKPILGICNGAQILVETGLVPGLENNALGMVLTENKRVQNGKVLGTGFYNTWVNMRLSDHYQLNAFTQCLKPNTVLSIPVAHGEGRFIIPPVLFAEMQRNGQTVFQYCDETGNIIPEFPTNPNGSMDNLAAVSNKMGNVMAMMPHPERTIQGDPIFQSMRQYIEKGYVQQVNPMHYKPRRDALKIYQAPPHSTELIVDLMITDNQAMTVTQALRQHELPVQLRRYVHWEITTQSDAMIEKIKATGVLYNNRKEVVLTKKEIKKSSAMTFLVEAKEDMVGQQKTQMLKNHFGIDGVEVRQRIVWQLDTPEYAESIINSNILCNPYAHDCYYYE